MHLRTGILGILLLFCASTLLFAQDTDNKLWDAVLDQYELVCKFCLDKKPVKEIKTETEKLRGMLKTVKGRMSNSQMQRFEYIKSRYIGVPGLNFTTQTEEKPRVDKVVVVDTIHRYKDVMVYDTLVVKEILASIDFNQNISKTDTLVHVVKVEAHLDSAHISMLNKPEKKRKGKFFIQAIVPVSKSLSFGIAAGWGIKSGVWISGQNNFESKKADYSLQEYEKHIWTTGKYILKRSSYCVGGYFPIWNFLSGFAGAGYGEHVVLWEDTDGRWAEIKPKSSRGLSYKAGIAAGFGPIVVGIGAGGVMSRVECELSLGVRF